ncbi:NDP-sugar synthase [candidate division FCPU426 bacterium]|nr:NDP-sugar synthase [candidate division FCPU426 bacterium]
MKAIILVGGEGTRLRPLTLHRLKSMVPMAGRPFLEYQFALLRRHHVREITLSICHKPDLIRRAFGSGKKYGVTLHYATEDKPLGTAGAIKNAERYVAGGREPVAVLNGDELTDWDFTRMAAFHQKHGALITIGLTWIADPTSYGLVLFNSRGRVTRFVEKPSLDEARSHWINSGLYIFNPRAFTLIPEGAAYSAERELFPNVLKQGECVCAYAGRHYWKDIGTPAKYHQAHIDILEGRLPMLPVGTPWRGKHRLRIGRACRLHQTARLYDPGIIGDNCQVGEEAQIGEFAVLGRRVKVEPRAVLQRCVIWDEVVVGEGARLTGCLVGAGCRIGRYAQVSPGAVLGDNAVIPDYSQV